MSRAKKEETFIPKRFISSTILVNIVVLLL